MSETRELRALKRAVKLAGGQSPLARALREAGNKRITQAHVWDWLNRRGYAPAEVCAAIEAATGVTRAELRPDIYA